MKMKKIAAAVMMVSMVAVTAVGCGSSNGTDTKGADTISQMQLPTGMRQVMLQSFPVRMVQVQGEPSLSCSESKRSRMTEQRLT